MVDELKQTSIESEPNKIDVLDSNYPLIVMLREKCPGTFAHSKNVALMLEAVGSELNLDVQKLKVAGYFHDIGKVLSPNLFTENQGEEENPHDKLEPWISHRLITSHVAETAKILVDDSNIPREIIEWCIQHHGTSVVRYFYEKSGSKNPDQYRYKCSKPKCVESMLLMICDHLEARTRALQQSNKFPTEIEDFINKVFQEMFDDEQFDEVSLPKLGHLRRIKQLLCRELSSQFHKRIDYEND